MWQFSSCTNILIFWCEWYGLSTKYFLNQFFTYDRNLLFSSLFLDCSNSFCTLSTFSDKHCCSLGTSDSCISIIPIGILFSAPENKLCSFKNTSHKLQIIVNAYKWKYQFHLNLDFLVSKFGLIKYARGLHVGTIMSIVCLNKIAQIIMLGLYKLVSKYWLKQIKETYILD